MAGNPVQREVVEAFYAAYAVRDAAAMLIEGGSGGNAHPALGAASRRRAGDQLPAGAFHTLSRRQDRVHLSLIDSYDAVEQVLGHSLTDLAGMPAHDENVVTV